MFKKKQNNRYATQEEYERLGRLYGKACDLCESLEEDNELLNKRIEKLSYRLNKLLARNTELVDIIDKQQGIIIKQTKKGRKNV